MDMTFEEALRHASDLSQVPEAVLSDIRGWFPHYLWIDDDPYRDDGGWPEAPIPGRHRRLVCEACGADWTEKRRRGDQTYPQNRNGVCPRCSAAVTAKHMSRGFQGLRNQVDVIYYGKSWICPDAVVAYAAHCERDYAEADPGAPWELETDVDVRGIAVFIYGRGGVRYQRHVTDWDINGGFVPARFEWRRVKTMAHMTFNSAMFGNVPPRHLSTDSLYDAIEDTPFARAWSDDYLLMHAMQDGIRALDMIARYPCIEYLTRFGWTDFLRKHLNGDLPKNLINWRGKDAAGVLRISPQRLGELKGKRIGVTPELLLVLQRVDRDGIRLGAETAEAVAHAMRGGTRNGAKDLDELLALFELQRQRKALKYVARLNATQHRSLGDVLDYWHAELGLGATLADDAVAFPRDFTAAHDRANTRRRIVLNHDSDKKIRKNYGKLDKRFGFAFGGLILRPAASAEEVIREGEALGHCVGSYVARYANGDTVICVLRRAVQPDAPWRTVELTRTGRLVQDRGYHNDWGAGSLMTPATRAALDLFWEAWRERPGA